MKINRNNYESWFLDYHEGTLAPEKVAELFTFLEEHHDLHGEFEAFELIHLSSDIPTVSFENKDYLRREELNDDQVREWMIDILEGNKPDEEEMLTAIAVRPDLLQEWKDLQKTILPKTAVPFPAKNLSKKNPDIPAGTEQLLIASLEGDLNLQERKKLNSLLENHPALKQEKELFQKTKLIPEAVLFPGKEKLKKRGARVIAYNINRTFLRAAASLVIILGAGFLLNRETEQPVRIAGNISTPVIKNNVDITTNDNKPNSTEKSSQQSNTQLPGKQLAENSAATPSKVNTRTNSISTNNNALATEINTLFETDQTLASIEPLPMKAAILPVEEPFVNVQRRPYHQTSVVAEEQQIALQPEELVKEAVTTASITVNKVTANTPLAAEANGTKLTLGSRAIRSLAWVVGKASDERIKIKTTFNPLTGTLAAYEVETANRKWQKQF